MLLTPIRMVVAGAWTLHEARRTVAKVFLPRASVMIGIFLATTGLTVPAVNVLAFCLWLLAIFLSITVESIVPGALLPF